MFPELIVFASTLLTVKLEIKLVVADNVLVDIFVETKFVIVLVGAYTDPVLIVFVCKFVTVKLVNKPLAIVLDTPEKVPLDRFVETKFVIVLVGA